MRKKSFLVTALCAVALPAMGAGSAFAGEVTGSGKPTPATERAHSICSFSGKNDDPKSTNPENPGGVAQSYGYSFVSKGLKATVPSPGVACNGHTGFFAGGGEE
jgi:hypothetical protein